MPCKKTYSFDSQKCFYTVHLVPVLLYLTCMPASGQTVANNTFIGILKRYFRPSTHVHGYFLEQNFACGFSLPYTCKQHFR